MQASVTAHTHAQTHTNLARTQTHKRHARFASAHTHTNKRRQRVRSVQEIKDSFVLFKPQTEGPMERQPALKLSLCISSSTNNYLSSDVVPDTRAAGTLRRACSPAGSHLPASAPPSLVDLFRRFPTQIIGRNLPVCRQRKHPSALAPSAVGGAQNLFLFLFLFLFLLPRRSCSRRLPEARTPFCRLLAV